MTPAAVYPFDPKTRKADIASIEGLPFTPVQAEIAIELFYEFSGNSSLMSADGFNRAIIYAFAMAFVSTDLRSDPEVARALRSGVTSSGTAYGLLRGISVDSDILRMTFKYFDIENQGIPHHPLRPDATL